MFGILTFLDHPLFIRLAIGLSLFLFGLAEGHHLGYRSEHAKFESYQVQVQAAAQVQAALTQQAITKAREAENETTQEWKRKYSALADSYSSDSARRVRYITIYRRTSKMPPASHSAESPDAADSEPGLDSRKYTIAGCAIDAEHVRLFQDWIKKNDFPIEK